MCCTKCRLPPPILFVCHATSSDSKSESDGSIDVETEEPTGTTGQPDEEPADDAEDTPKGHGDDPTILFGVHKGLPRQADGTCEDSDFGPAPAPVLTTAMPPASTAQEATLDDSSLFSSWANTCSPG